MHNSFKSKLRMNWQSFVPYQLNIDIGMDIVRYGKTPTERETSKVRIYVFDLVRTKAIKTRQFKTTFYYLQKTFYTNWKFFGQKFKNDIYWYKYKPMNWILKKINII